MKRKILFIIPTLQGGGAEKLLIDILRNIDYAKYDVQLMYFYQNNIYIDQIPGQVKLIVPFFIKNTLWDVAKRVFLRVTHLQDVQRRRKIRACADKHYDCIISFLEGMSLHFHTFLTDRANKNITYMHTDISRYQLSLNRQSEKEYSQMDAVAFVSKQAMDSFKRVFPENRSEHIVMPNFIDIDIVKARASQFTVQHNIPTIVCVGRIIPVKGFDLLPDIAMLLKKKMPQFIIRIVGTGEDEQKLKNKIDSQNLSEFFSFEGFQRNPYPYIANASLMLSTSVAEGFSLVICESMALGTPVISSKTDGAMSMLSAGAGVLVERTPEAFADAILSLMSDNSLYENYVEAGLSKSLDHDKSIYMPDFYKLIS